MRHRKIMSETMRASVHNASKCTLDGRDYYIAALTDSRGVFRADQHPVSGYDSIEEAIDWAAAELQRRGIDPQCVDLEDGSCVRRGKELKDA